MVAGEPIPVPQPESVDEIRKQFPLEPLTNLPAEEKKPVTEFVPIIPEAKTEINEGEAFNLVGEKVQAMFDRMLNDGGMDSTLRNNLAVVLPWVKAVLATSQKNPLEQNGYHLTDELQKAAQK